MDTDVDFGGRWRALERRFEAGLREINDNPQFLLYKLKTNGYKFSWALIPLSIPFMWLLFFWRRDIHLYDHAIFVTYSITFMMLFLIVLSIAASIGRAGSHLGNGARSRAADPPLQALARHLRPVALRARSRGCSC